MSNSDCIIRAFGGCACKDTCAETRVTPAPVVLISARTQAIVCLFLGFVAMIDFDLRKAGVTVDDD